MERGRQASVHVRLARRNGSILRTRSFRWRLSFRAVLAYSPFARSLTLVPSFKIQLGSDTVAAIGDEESIGALVARDLLEEENDLLGKMTHYCRDDRGTPGYGSLRIDPENISLREDLTGTVVVEFQEQAYYGCRQMDIQDDREVEVSFRIDRQSKTLTYDVPESSRISDWQESGGE